MRKQILTAFILCFFAGAASAGFSLGRPAAVKKQVSKLDDKVHARQLAGAAANQAPANVSVTAISTTVAAGGLAVLSVSAIDPDGDTLHYSWSAASGTLSGTSGASVYWLAPSTPGVYSVNCVVSDGKAAAPGSVGVAAVTPGTLKWKFTPSTAANFLVSPAVGNGGIVYATADNRLFAVNTDGLEKWVFTLESPDNFNTSFGPVIGGDGTIYAVTDSGKTYALNPDKSSKWATPFVSATTVSVPPVIAPDGTAYVYDDSANLYQVTPGGIGVSTFTDLTGIPGPPAIGANGTIYLLDGSDVLYSIPPEGLIASTATDMSGISVPLTIASDGTIYWVDTALHAWEADGSDKWGTSFPFTGVVSDNPVLGTDAGVYLYSYDSLAPASVLYKVSSGTGAGMPFTPVPALTAVNFSAAPGPGGAVYVVDSDTDLYGINSAGSTEWGPVAPDSGIISAPPQAGSDGTVAFTDDTASGSVYAVYSTAALPVP